MACVQEASAELTPPDNDSHLIEIGQPRDETDLPEGSEPVLKKMKTDEVVAETLPAPTTPVDRIVPAPAPATPPPRHKKMDPSFCLWEASEGSKHLCLHFAHQSTSKLACTGVIFISHAPVDHLLTLGRYALGDVILNLFQLCTAIQNVVYFCSPAFTVCW